MRDHISGMVWALAFRPTPQLLVIRNGSVVLFILPPHISKSTERLSSPPKTFSSVLFTTAILDISLKLQ